MFRKPLLQFSRSCSTKISIPYAIKRTPTELLEALNTTVGVDKTAPHFSFIDDPLTIPTSDYAKRVYFQSKELGKRAARQLATEWPTLFMYDIDEPRLPVFRPTHPLSMMPLEGTEDELIKLIDAKEVKTAGDCYEKIRSKGENVSDQVQMDLFKLVVYYNENDVPLSENKEYPALRNMSDNKDSYIPWVKQSLSDLLFETIPKSSETYSIMISGLCKHTSSYSVETALKLYNEMLSNKMIPSIQAFNGLISVSSQKGTIGYLKKINELKVQPNVDTLNACIQVASKKAKFEEKLNFVQKLILEFRLANVQPNLYTYDLIINYLKPTANEKTTENFRISIAVLDQIITKLETMEEIRYENENDSNFFRSAMYLAVDANNALLVERINKVYSDKKNKVKLIAFMSEENYYYKYLVYNLLKLPLSEAGKIYLDLVPRVVSVYPDVLKIFMNRLIQTPNWRLTKRVVEDFITRGEMIFGGSSKLLIKTLTSTDVNSLSPEELLNFKETLTKCLNIWKEVAQFAQEKDAKFMTNIDDKFIEETTLKFSKYLN
uniref:Small ribosomal subunit protein mS39 n=1 Tax=Parastrongyloides trichosuri TaxID=131310 RepID=A0A0N4ZFZ1_PARTI